MPSQKDKASHFHSLHVKGDPVVLYNIWDPGSAKAVEGAGAKALATGSAPVAMAQGYGDGQQLPMDVSLSNAKAIAERTDLPLSLDFEGGYAVEPAEIQANVAKALETGVVGFNFEDQIVGGDGLYDMDTQAARVAAVRVAIDASGVDAYINARTDIFLKNKPDTHNDAMLEEAIARAKAYEDAGASGFFAPLLIDEAMIGKLCEATNLPVNIIALPGCPPKAKLAELGVARLSYGPVAYKQAMAGLAQAAAEAFA